MYLEIWLNKLLLNNCQTIVKQLNLYFLAILVLKAINRIAETYNSDCIGNKPLAGAMST